MRRLRPRVSRHAAALPCHEGFAPMMCNRVDTAPEAAARSAAAAAFAPAAWTRRFGGLVRHGLASSMLSFAFGAAAAADLVPVAQVEQDYVKPQQRVDVGGGRRMNLFCLGEGRITVVFDSGLSDWSSTWALSQPAV